MNRIFRRAVLLGTVALTVVGAGCAEERPSIRRVQSDALAKSFFVGKDIKDIVDDPEFYMRGTIVDVGYGAAQDGLFTSTYAQPVSRIKWEVTERQLNARLAYERIDGTDGKGNNYKGLTKKTTNDGQIVASYAIESHFDIVRDYNPSTGEESNVIVENTSDRLWYEREYFRVDWSRNLVTDAYDFDTLSQIGIYGGVEYEPLAYYVSDPASADAPRFDVESGYFDVTTKAFATPVLLDLSSLGWGIEKFPACMLPGDFAGGTDPYGNCNPVEITIRQSFKKVVDTDYEPIDFDGVRFQAFGIFTAESRYGYERNYGIVDNQWRRFASRYNLWKRSHFYGNPETMEGAIACATRETAPGGDVNADPNLDKDNDGTADACAAAGAGSQCDVYKQKCTLPYAEREAVVIPWYVGGDTSEDIFEATQWAAEEWDLAMKTAIQTSRLVECRKTGGQDCDAQFPMWKGQQDDIDEAVALSRALNACRREQGWDASICDDQAKQAVEQLSQRRGGDQATLAIGGVVTQPSVIVLCHNPVIEGDHPACGDTSVPLEERVAPRLGDLRYNSVLIVEKPQKPSPWGIMADADDPLTGEKVAASINIWSHVTDSAAQQLVDLVRYINGEIPTSEITDGKYIRDWAQASRISGGGQGPTMTKREVTSRLASATKLDPEAYESLVAQGVSPQLKALIEPMKAKVADIAVRGDIASPQQAIVGARMKAARGSLAESELMNPAMLKRAGIPAGLPIEGPLADAASPFAMNNPKLHSQLRHMHDNALAERGACILHEAPEATAMTGLAEALREKFPVGNEETADEKRGRYERMFKYLQRRYHYAVIAHEMGHSIGLRHNFVSSYASLFFRPQYWQLRTKNGKVKAACTGEAGESPEECVGPRYFDAITDEEQKNMIWMFQHSTVMDYPGDVSQDLVGLGVYDFAAARFFYGDTVSVYDNGERNYLAGGRIGGGLLAAADNFGGLAGIKYGMFAKGNSTNAPSVNDFHYSQLQAQYEVIRDCYDVQATPPATWNERLDGKWHTLLDGGIVKVGDETKRCRQQPVDYVGWKQLRMPQDKETALGAFRGGPAVDAQNRVRVPYAFATDNWADLGNVSVFRHDNGADPYEQLMFLITTQENRHIFDNFRRNLTTFNVRTAADRSYERYNEKMLGIAGGIGFFGTIYQDLATNQGLSFDTLWPLLIEGGLQENVVAATVAFDHFTRQLARPEEGPHYLRDPLFNDPVLRSNLDGDDYGAGEDFGSFGGTTNSPVLVQIPNGSTGYLKDVGFGGHPLENRNSEVNGDFNSDYTSNAGSYYDKINTAILLSESEDRFVSQSRRDFYDARFRAVGMADVLPEGYRRVLANALTGDRSLLAPRLEADNDGFPVLDEQSKDPDPLAKEFPARPMGWVSWWPNEGPKVCFPTDGKNLCTNYTGGDFDPAVVDRTIAVDPQIGWEVQKFLIAWTLANIPANGKTNWLDMMRVYRLGSDADPGIEQRIEWQDPTSGQIYYARTYGMECLFGAGKNRAACEGSGGRWVQKGIAARVIEYANALTVKGYQLDTQKYVGQLEPDQLPPDGSIPSVPGDPAYVAEYGPGFNKYGRPMITYHPDGAAIIIPDPAIKDVPAVGPFKEVPACDQNINENCTQLTIYKNHYAYELKGYKSVPDYLLKMMVQLELADPEQLGLYLDNDDD
ncbi:zinc-dependent metalloprotease [Sorangium sp. So ce327]|uniref:zinc-dependent metalloprotease n=1 Tax=Sorangium sp. So ce327 TaxID=3133301 RepID=UPI003F60AD84